MSYQDKICNLLSSCLARKELPLRKGWFIHINMRVQLHCIAKIHVVYLKEVDTLLLSWNNPLSAKTPFSTHGSYLHLTTPRVFSFIFFSLDLGFQVAGHLLLYLLIKVNFFSVASNFKMASTIILLLSSFLSPSLITTKCMFYKPN